MMDGGTWRSPTDAARSARITRSPVQRARDVLLKKLLVEGFGGVAKAGVKHAAALKLVRPGDGIRIHVGLTDRGGVHGEQQAHAWIEVLVVIPFVDMLDRLRQFSGRG